MQTHIYQRVNREIEISKTNCAICVPDRSGLGCKVGLRGTLGFGVYVGLALGVVVWVGEGLAECVGEGLAVTVGVTV